MSRSICNFVQGPEDMTKLSAIMLLISISILPDSYLKIWRERKLLVAKILISKRIKLSGNMSRE